MATATKTTNPMLEMVSIHIPKASGEDRTVFVGLNGRGWNIPRGMTVEVPKPVADVFYAAQDNATKADEYSEAKHMQEMQGAKEFAAKTGAIV